jgi:hypothetical protein
MITAHPKLTFGNRLAITLTVATVVGWISPEQVMTSGSQYNTYGIHF